MSPRLTFETLERAAYGKGWVVRRRYRRGRGYDATPHSEAIFAKQPCGWGFGDIGQLARFVERCVEPIAYTWSPNSRMLCLLRDSRADANRRTAA